MKSLKSNQLSRLFKIGTTVAKVTGEYALDKATELVKTKAEQIEENAKKIKAAKEIIQSMGELKGGLMKIGQMISITEDLVLPKEVSELFKKLQKDSPSMPKEDILKVFQEDFGCAPEELFESFDWEPIASASIGQVHIATTKEGQRLAVKIQYPKIVKAIKADLNNLGSIDKLFSLILPKKIDITPMLEEIKESLLNECDYELEAENIKKFRGFLKDTFPSVIVPDVNDKYSSKRILSTEYMDADTFDKTLDYPQETKDKLGKALYDSFLYSLFHQGILHTDPQEGNYLFKNDKIILLDFGSTRSFNEHFIKYYSLLCLSVELDDNKLFRHTAINLELAQEDTPEDVVKSYFDLASKIYKPFMNEGAFKIEKVNPFQMVKEFVMKIDDLSDKKVPMREFLLLDRANIGLFTKLKKWESSVDWMEGKKNYQYPIEKKYIKELIEEGVLDNSYMEYFND